MNPQQVPAGHPSIARVVLVFVVLLIVGVVGSLIAIMLHFNTPMEQVAVSPSTVLEEARKYDQVQLLGQAVGEVATGTDAEKVRLLKHLNKE